MCVARMPRTTVVERSSTIWRRRSGKRDIQMDLPTRGTKLADVDPVVVWLGDKGGLLVGHVLFLAALMPLRGGASSKSGTCAGDLVPNPLIPLGVINGYTICILSTDAQRGISPRNPVLDAGKSVKA